MKLSWSTARARLRRRSSTLGGLAVTYAPVAFLKVLLGGVSSRRLGRLRLLLTIQTEALRRTLGLGRDVRHWHTTKARGDLSK